MKWGFLHLLVKYSVFGLVQKGYKYFEFCQNSCNRATEALTEWFTMKYGLQDCCNRSYTPVTMNRPHK